MLKSKLRAFTLLECLLALLVISGSISVYQGLTKVISSNVHYLSQNQEESWLLFCQQLRSELAVSHFDKIADNKLYVKRGQQGLAFGKSKSHDFRKTNADGRGYQPMLSHIKSADFQKKEDLLVLRVTFTDGLERTFIYAFDQES